MTRTIISLVLLAVALPAYARETTTTTTREYVIDGAQPTADGTPSTSVVITPEAVAAAEVARINAEVEAGKALTDADIAAKKAEGDAKVAALKAESDAKVAATKAESEAMTKMAEAQAEATLAKENPLAQMAIGRRMSQPATQAYTAKEVTDEGNDVFGGSLSFSTQVDDCIAIATSQARKAKLAVVGDIITECRRIAVEQTEADNATLALLLDRSFSSRHGATNEAAPVFAGGGYYGRGSMGYQTVAYDTQNTRDAMDATQDHTELEFEPPPSTDTPDSEESPKARKPKAMTTEEADRAAEEALGIE